MAYMVSNTASNLKVFWSFSNRHRLAKFWLVTIALFVTRPLLISTSPLTDGPGKLTDAIMIEVDADFDRFVDQIKGLVSAVATGTSSGDKAARLRKRDASSGQLLSVSEAIKHIAQGSDFPFEAPNSCSLTENELNNINNLLESLGSGEVRSNLTCEVKEDKLSVFSLPGSPEYCNQIIESIIRNINGVKHAFRCLNASEEVTDQRYEELKAAYEGEVRRLNSLMENEKKKFDQKFQEEIDKLKKSYHEIEKKMQEILEKFQEERLAHSIVSIKLIVECLVNGNTELALETHKAKSMGISKTIAIVQRAIGKEFNGRVPNKNVIKFIDGLKDNVDAMVHGIISVFSEMEKRQILDRDTVNSLHVTIKNVIKTCIDLEGTDSEESKLTLDDHTMDELIVINNKIEFLKYSYGQ
ncbi:uncharacterized protein LOC130699605 [Daphnia carinata]|uniref:uncharacterized protein LOC130699605 n=1 Tax=Daphnia carinata TaxID=120202 RepID=UPI00257A9F3D|nr:uncharacterized protein LOC130699605 [Daphnia carinata]